MTMVGDMFNSGLQSTVSGICSDLSALMASGQALVTPAGRSAAGTFGSFGGDWWPSDLGRPSSSGGQNDASYAYCPGPRRLAVRRGSQVTLYDTGEHAISGVQQQQGSRGSLEFSSQFGTFTVDSLPVVGGDGGGLDPRRPEDASPAASRPPASSVPGVPSAPAPPPFHPRQSQSQSQQSFARPTQAAPTDAAHVPAPVAAAPSEPEPAPAAQPADLRPADPLAAAAHPAAPPPPAAPTPAPPPAEPPQAAAPAPAQSGVATSAAEIGAAIETLGGLRDKGFLTEEEFAAKKAEILARL